MFTYVIKKIRSDWKESIGNILFGACLIAVVIICTHITVRINEMIKDDWYKSSLEVASIGDSFIREKMAVILWFLIWLLGIIYIFSFVLYGLKLKMDIAKEHRRISLFQVLGYTSLQRIGALYFGKSIELFIASVIGSMMASGIWKLLCKHETFLKLMTMMNENSDYQWQFCLIVSLTFAVWGFFIICLIITKKTNIAETLKGAENE